MNCERARTFIERAAGDGRQPLRLRLHLLRCASCAAEAERMDRALRALKGCYPPLSLDFSQSIMHAIRGAPRLEAAPVSFRSWLAVGITLLAATGLAPLGGTFGWVKTAFGSNFLLPLNIVLGLSLAGYCALFIGTHLDEIAEKLKLKHDGTV